MSNHNLNISMYSLEEILGLFNLTYDIDLDGIKRAKKKVLMLHPDKSRLSSDYFIFYKHAFEIIVRYYEEQTRHNRKTSSESTIYSQINETDKNVKRTINGTPVVMNGLKMTNRYITIWRTFQFKIWGVRSTILNR